MNCLEIICRAMRRLGVLAGGELPRDIESQDALATLSSIYARLISEGAFGELSSVIASQNMTAGHNQRIIVNDLTTVVTLPETIGEDGCLKPIRDGAIVIIANHVVNQVTTYIRDAQANIWLDLDNLTLTSPAPLSRRDPMGLACYLAVELSDEYGQQPSEITVRNAARFQMGITHNWAEEQQVVRGVYF